MAGSTQRRHRASLFICDEKHLLKHEKFTLRASAIAVTRGASLLSNGRCGFLCTIGPGCSTTRWGVDTSFRRDCIQITGCARLAREAIESLWYLPLPKLQPFLANNLNGPHVHARRLC